MQMITTVPTATIPPITPPAIAPALLPPLSLSPVLDSVGDVVTTTAVTAVDDDSDIVIAVDENVAVMIPPNMYKGNTSIHTYIWLVYT